MSLCRNLERDSDLGLKILEVSEKIGGTALYQKELTELCLLVDNVISQHKECYELLKESKIELQKLERLYPAPITTTGQTIINKIHRFKSNMIKYWKA